MDVLARALAWPACGAMVALCVNLQTTLAHTGSHIRVTGAEPKVCSVHDKSNPGGGPLRLSTLA